MEKGRVHLIIRGFVQGVFFRASTKDVALKLGLTGWVRNLPNGNVEAEFEGPMDKLRQAVEWCKKGPTGARVTGIDEKWFEYHGEYKAFDIRYGY